MLVNFNSISSHSNFKVVDYYEREFRYKIGLSCVQIKLIRRQFYLYQQHLFSVNSGQGEIQFNEAVIILYKSNQAATK